MYQSVLFSRLNHLIVLVAYMKGSRRIRCKACLEFEKAAAPDMHLDSEVVESLSRNVYPAIV